ncbi:serine/threonine protein kinase [Mesobaculum littorinae]|uniref:Serine/threonine protein kinase n=1 Tax=Mesobaculum littorinae TaxID=2486419 RepID=A0A438ADB8_9RHOB|nr:serine/threonine protein kinase [Mesobaculum littorinae]RVV96690.1 serine/threonine protein kinase [Mesobaculum littorinae]
MTGDAPSSSPVAPPRFVADAVLKRDAFSETVSGHDAADPAHKLALRRLDGLPAYSRWLARWLAAREARALAAVSGIAGTPTFLHFDGTGLLRDWTEGRPLQHARPADAAWYRDARRLLREMRRRGVTHNDLAKPQNWLATPDGRAAVIDFQLAHLHRRRGRWYRLCAYEDLRHLMKMKRRYARAQMTPLELRLAAERSAPSRLWRATGKRAYIFVTRRLIHWSDNEGAGDRLGDEGPALHAELLAHPRIHDAAIATYPRPGGGAGLYGFAETDLSAADLRRLLPRTRIEHLQPVARLPRDAAGAPRHDLLGLIAANRIDEIAALAERDPALSAELAPILATRSNLTDRDRA